MIKSLKRAGICRRVSLIGIHLFHFVVVVRIYYSIWSSV